MQLHTVAVIGRGGYVAMLMVMLVVMTATATVAEAVMAPTLV